MDTKRKLIEIGAELFAERGYNGVSIRDLVHRAKVNLGAVTYHFGGKDGLFEAVIADRITPIRESMDAIAASDLSPREKLSSLLRTHALQVLHEDPSVRILFREQMRRKCRRSNGNHKPHEMINRRNKMIGDIIRKGIADGSFRKCDVDSAVWIFFGLLSPHMWRGIRRGKSGRAGKYPKAAVNKIVDNALSIFFHGLAGESDRPRKRKRS